MKRSKYKWVYEKESGGEVVEKRRRPFFRWEERIGIQNETYKGTLSNLHTLQFNYMFITEFSLFHSDKK